MKNNKFQIFLYQLSKKNHKFVDKFLLKSNANEFSYINKCLIISLDYIGDYCIRTMPAIYLLKKAFPLAEISVLAGTWASELVKINPAVKTVKIYNPAWLDRNKKKWSLLRKIKVLFALRKKHYDLIIDVRGSVGISLWYLLRPARYIARLQDFIRMLPKFFPQESAKTWRDIKEEAEKEKKEFIVIPEVVKASVRNLLAAEDVDLRKKVVSIHPSAHSKVRQWLPDRWAIVIDNLVNVHSVEVLVCGDATAKDHINCIMSRVKSKAHNFVGKTTLLQLLALIQMSDLCISIDSGPMHIAGFLDVPVVGLLGPNNPRICHPLTTKWRLIFKDLSCAGCIENMTGCNTECMEAITCKDVIHAVTDLNEKLRFLN